MWSILKAGFSFLFGGSNTANKIVDTASSIARSEVYTDADKAANNNKILDWLLKYQEITTPQNAARRVIAFEIVTLWTVLVFMAVIAWPFYKDYSVYIFKVLRDVVDEPFKWIMGFYFATHLARALVNKVRQTDGPGKTSAGN